MFRTTRRRSALFSGLLSLIFLLGTSGSYGASGAPTADPLAGHQGARPEVAASASTTNLVDRTYSATSKVIANPERGFFHYTEATYRGDGSDYASLDRETLTRWRLSEQVTQAYRVIYLEKFRNQDTIDAGFLQLLEADLATARAAGVKLILRFAYTGSTGFSAAPYGDAPLTRVVSHIRQIAPVLNDNDDVIEVLQAGFIGLWGEWYYTDHFADDPAAPWRLSDANWTDRQTVLRTLLESTDPSIMLQVRYPSIKQRLLGVGPQARRVGIHNDCFLASADDYGTFASSPLSDDMQWLANDSLTAPMGGETCATNAPRSLWAEARVDLAKYHWTFLNADYHPAVLDSWGEEGLAEARRRLGYRLRLISSSLQATAKPDSSVHVGLRISNVGYAAPFRSRPVQLILASPRATYVATLPLDVRKWQPGMRIGISAEICAPPIAATYSLFMNFPDPKARLAQQTPLPSGESTNAAYSIQLANMGTWDAARGWNNLRHRIDVSADATASTAVCELPLRRVA